MKHTNLLLFTCLNLFICLITIIVCTSYNDNHNSYAISEKTTKITNTYNDSIFDVFNELQNYIKDNIDNKINKLNQNVENINNKISTINKDVIDLKNPKEEITIPNDNLRELEI